MTQYAISVRKNNYDLYKILLFKSERRTGSISTDNLIARTRGAPIDDLKSKLISLIDELSISEPDLDYSTLKVANDFGMLGKEAFVDPEGLDPLDLAVTIADSDANSRTFAWSNLDESADPNFDVHYAVEVWHTPDEEEEFFWRLVVVFKFAHHTDYDIAPKIGPEYASGAEDIRIKIKPLLLEHEVTLRKKHKYREDQLAFTKYKNLMVYQKRFKFLDELLDPEGLDPVDLAIHIAKMYRR